MKFDTPLADMGMLSMLDAQPVLTKVLSVRAEHSNRCSFFFSFFVFVSFSVFVFLFRFLIDICVLCAQVEVIASTRRC